MYKVSHQTAFLRILILSRNQPLGSCMRREAVFLRGFRCRKGGICLISMGIGIWLALVLPVGVIMFVSGLTLIVLGVTFLKL